MTIRDGDVGDSQVLSKGLQVAVSVGHADGANMVTFAEKHFNDYASIVPQALGVDEHLHAFLYLGYACGKESVVALDLNQTDTTGANFGESFDMAECGNVNSVLLGDLQDSLVLTRAHVLSINLQRLDL
jgi:hypothetical protein